MKSKRWRRRNRKTRPEWTLAEFQYYKFPAFPPYCKHLDLRQLDWELRKSDLTLIG